MYRMIVAVVAGLVVLTTGRASAHCSEQALRGFTARAQEAAGQVRQFPALAEMELRNADRNLLDCANTSHGDARQEIIIQVVRQQIAISYATAMAEEGRLSEARAIIARVRRRITELTQVLGPKAPRAKIIAKLQHEASMVDSLAHQQQGRISMKAASGARVETPPRGNAVSNRVARVSPTSCAHPNVQPGTDSVGLPVMPAIAQQQGITGDVTVDVSLDENSRVTAVSVESSPSNVLNAAALDAARRSTFHTEVRDCKSIAGVYRYVVTFDAQ